MGLLLSVLVACVGVVELLAFYSNVRRSLVTTSTQTDLSDLSRRYWEGLHRHRDNILNDLQASGGAVKRTPKTHCNGNATSAVLPHDKGAKSSLPEFGEKAPGLTNRQINDSQKWPKFLTKNSEEVLVLAKTQRSVDQEIFGTEDHDKVLDLTNGQIDVEGGTGLPRLVAEDDPLLSKRFILTEIKDSASQNETGSANCAIEDNENFYANIVSKRVILEEGQSDVFQNRPGLTQIAIDEDADSRKDVAILAESRGVEPDNHQATLAGRSETPSPIPNQIGDDYRRSPSPYPPSGMPVPRNSLCSELFDNPVAFLEIDERSKSPTPEKVLVVLESSHNTCDYWSNKLLVVPPSRPRFSDGRKRRSVSPNLQRLRPQLERRRRSKSATESVIENESYDERFLDSLDGVSKKKINRHAATRRSSKRKKTLKATAKDDVLSSRKNNESQTAKTLTEAANVLKNVNGGGEEAGCSSENQRPEPFWLIFSGEYTKAMNKDWHGQHFCCWQCDESLTGQRYVLRDDHPYCVSCYESVFANACEKCSRTIGIDSKDLSYKDKHWHEACFLCTTCGESLVDKQFGSKGDRIYCGRCYDEQFASRCDGCHEIFRAGTKKMEYKTRQWHEKCFCCCVCKVPIGTQSFIPREQEIYCAKCYEEKFATRCIKCNKVITSGGVTYKNEPWHRECFTCTNCNKSLAGERFTSRDEKPYCADCFGELFAKRCFACNKPITGIGGTKFISFEDRHWHNDCFFCASCRTSLVGRGFITDQEDIICPECAKQKLM